MSATFEANLVTLRATERVRVQIARLTIAGWVGRDEAAVRAHIEELQRLGVPAPRSTPVFYRAASALLTTENAIEVVGRSSSGEAEVVVFNREGRYWIGVGSDHTDRELEKTGVSVAKQICAKPVGCDWWPYAELSGHWDELVLRSYATRGRQRTLYQEASLATLRPVEDLMARAGGVPPGEAMFCGTVPVKGGIEWADALEIELEDQVLNRRLSHRYEIHPLPVEG